jgi:hypothetical protein
MVMRRRSTTTEVLSPAEERSLQRADARERSPAPPTMRERIAQRLREAVHDRMAFDAVHASQVGDPATEHVCRCPVPDGEMPYTDMDLGDGLGPIRVTRSLPRGRPYPYRMGGSAMRRRVRYLAAHSVRLRALETNR